MKKIRQEEILSLIRSGEIETQEELSEKLKEKGFPVTQATVSRDIRELGLRKIPGTQGRMVYSAADRRGGDDAGSILREIRSLDTAANLVVLKTSPGLAMALGAKLDAMRLNGVVGSIAGDDTVFLAVKSRENAERVLETVRTLS